MLAGHRVLLCGNGGSAADAQHLAAELVGRFVVERRPLAAIALTTDTSALTAIANDYGYEHVFSRQVDALGAAGDVLIAITTSGASANVIAAAACARRRRGMKVIGLTGSRGATFVASCDAGVAVPSLSTARIQECHITIGHLLCEVLDEAFAAPVARSECGEGPHKVMTLDDLVAWRDAQRARKRTVVWAHGVFDAIHVGHVRSLRAARGLGDALVVGVGADDAVGAIDGRPIHPFAERAELLAAIDTVDAITVYGDLTLERVLAAVKPDVHAGGADPAPHRAGAGTST